VSPLESALRARGVALAQVEPGANVPEVFSDARAEHLATRRAAGLFDFSFMGLCEFAGGGGLSVLQRLQTRNAARLAPGQLCYTLLLQEDGSVLTDATLWRVSGDRFWLFAGRRSDIARIEGLNHAAGRSGESAVLALQGPASGVILARLAGEAFVRALHYFRFAQARVAGLDAVVGRLGYSGELGYELVIPGADAPALWDALLEAGHADGLLECGFTAADSLRIESGYVLFGHEIDQRADPYELRLGRLVEFDGRDFRGVHALAGRRHAASARKLCALELADGGPVPSARTYLPRTLVTGECDSPVFRRRLALGFVAAADASPGTRVALGDGRRARVVRLPVYDPCRRLPRAMPL
jgi:aminomethyltransferase